MPFINVKLSTDVTKEQADVLKTEIGRAVSIIGKGESYLMVGIEKNCTLYFGGTNENPSAFFEVKILGKSTRDNYTRLTERLCQIAKEMFNINSERVYVKFEEVENWGHNGYLF